MNTPSTRSGEEPEIVAAQDEDRKSDPRPQDRDQRRPISSSTPVRGTSPFSSKKSSVLSTILERSSATKNKRDPLNTEFIYYSASLKNLAPALSSESDRCRVIPWIRKLFGPEYQPEKLRSKRNKYLCSLTITLTNDEVSGVFCNPPPSGVLYELEDLQCERFEKAEWEDDTFWEDMVDGLPESYFKTDCMIHASGECEPEGDMNQSMLDEEFRLFLYLVRPYAALLPEREDKAKVASWLQLLCSLPKGSCVGMKSLRNDYIRSLYGCLNDLQMPFPFDDFAPNPPLPLPVTLAKDRPPKQRFTDPTSSEADDFLRAQPVPENGAFCYVAVSGEVLESSFPEEPEMDTSALKVRMPSTDHAPGHAEMRASYVEIETSFMPQTEDKPRPCVPRTPGR